MYKFYYGNINYSSWSIRPMVLMRHFNIDYEPCFISMFDDAWYDGGREKLKPSYTLPVLETEIDNKKIKIWDSLAIIEFLAKQHKDINIWPKDDAKKAIARSISAEMHSSFSKLRSAQPMNIRLQLNNFKKPYEAQDDIDRIIELWKLAKEQYGDGGEYLFGKFSAADAIFAPVIFRLVNYNIELPDFSHKYCQIMLENKAMKSIIQDAHHENITIQKYEDFLAAYV